MHPSLRGPVPVSPAAGLTAGLFSSSTHHDMFQFSPTKVTLAHQEIPVADDLDLLVCGGAVAGIALPGSQQP